MKCKVIFIVMSFLSLSLSLDYQIWAGTPRIGASAITNTHTSVIVVSKPNDFDQAFISEGSELGSIKINDGDEYPITTHRPFGNSFSEYNKPLIKVTIENKNVPEKQPFRVSINNAEFYNGNSVREFTCLLKKYAIKNSLRALSIDLNGFNENRAKDISLTLRFQFANSDLENLIIFESLDTKNSPEEILFEKGVLMQIGLIKNVTEGPKKDFFSATIDLTKDNSNIKLTVYAKLRVHLLKLIDKLTSLTSGKQLLDDRSPAQYIQRALEELMRENNISHKDLIFELGHLEFVNLFRFKSNRMAS